MVASTPCPLCSNPGGELLWQDDLCRVVLIAHGDEAYFPGYCRVIWNAHIGEMSDLTASQAQHLMNIVVRVEHVLRQTVQADKINLASLGNMTPHVHWHIIPRWRDDSHFPASTWAAALRPICPKQELTQEQWRQLGMQLASRLQNELPGSHPSPSVQ